MENCLRFKSQSRQLRISLICTSVVISGILKVRREEEANRKICSSREVVTDMVLLKTLNRLGENVICIFFQAHMHYLTTVNDFNFKK